MAIIQVIQPIEVTHRGPEVPAGDDWHRVHLQQGALDGACGPYSVFMALVALGLLDPDEISFRVDGRSRLGKLQSRMTSSGLFADGTSIAGLGKAIEDSFGAVVNVEVTEARGAALRRFVIEHLVADCPVVIGLEGKGLAHWVLAVGLQFADREAEAPRRLLVLDPGCPAAPVSAWNRVIDLDAGGGRYPYRLWLAEGREERQAVQLAHAAAIWRRP